MNLNKNNYEEYFLLYADNELSNAERKMVEVFVKENPEFREEFCMLKLTINIPEDEIRLEDKSFLFKNERSFFLNKDNYEEVFVHYHDKEFSEKEKLETESFLSQHPELKSEFELIGKAKLSPDTSIVYPDKKELYRKETSGKVVTLMWWRYAVAAVLVGFGLWIVSPYFNNPASNHPAVTGINETNNPAPAREVILPKDVKPLSHQTTASVNEKAVDNLTNESHFQRAVMHTMLKDKPATNELATNTVNITTPSLTKNIQELKKEPVEVIALKASDEKKDRSKDDIQKAVAMQAKSPVEVTEPEMKRDYAHTVAYNESSSNNNYVFYDVPAEEFKKSKVGGFLKKVKRIVERTNPITRLLEGNDEPVVANKF